MGCNVSSAHDPPPSNKKKRGARGSVPSQLEEQECHVGSHLLSPTDIKSYPIFPEYYKSLLKKHLTKEMWQQLKDRKDKYGFTFQQAIFPGCKGTDDTIGVVAGSEDSYHEFALLFDKLITDFHGVTHTLHAGDVAVIDTQLPQINDKLDTINLQQLGIMNFTIGDKQFIHSIRIRVSRNLAANSFTVGMKSDQRINVMNKVVLGLSSLDNDLEGRFYALKDMPEEIKQQLQAKSFLFELGQTQILYNQEQNDALDGRGIFVNNDQTLVVWVNEFDHIKIFSLQQGSDFEQVFMRIVRVLTHLEKFLKFAYDPHFGYLSPELTNIGTSMRISFQLISPSLVNSTTNEKLTTFQQQYNIRIKEVDKVNNIIDVSNKIVFGKTETQIMLEMKQAIKSIVALEFADMIPDEKNQDQI